MRGGQHKVARGVDQGRLAYGIAPPEDEDQVVAVAREAAYDLVGELLPALSLVRSGPVGLDGEGGVEQQHPLGCPTRQIAVGRERGPGVGAHLLEDVDQRGGHPHARIDREAQAVCLSRAVIGILPEDDDLDFVEGTRVEGGENFSRRREDLARGVLPAGKLGGLAEGGGVEYVGKLGFPAWVDSDVHGRRNGRKGENGENRNFRMGRRP